MKDDIVKSKKKFAAFDLDGNNPALDFVNTVEYRNTESEKEWITSYIDALCWADRTSILSVEQSAHLLEGVNEETRVHLLGKIYESRKILYNLLSGVIDRVPDLLEAERRFNSLYSQVKREIHTSVGSFAFSWIYPGIENDPLGFLNPVILAAADLLVTGNLERLKRCSDSSCGWLYYDTSKNNSRRWCCMKTCGNRAKANKFYQTHKEQL